MKTLLLPLLLLTAAPARAEEPLELTLEKSVDLALAQNLDVDLAERRLETLQSYYRQALAAAVPDVNYGGSWMRTLKKQAVFLGNAKIETGKLNNMRHALTAEQVVFSGGVVSAGIRATKTGIAAGEDELQAAKADVTLAARRLFYAVLLSSETSRIQEDNLASAEDHLRTIEERFRQGLDSDLLVLRQKVEVANARPVLIQSRNQYELSLLLFKDTLGLDIDAPVRVVGRLTSPQGSLPPYEPLRDKALIGNPDYQAALERLHQSEAMVRVAQGLRMPQLSVYADYQWYSDSDELQPAGAEQATSSQGGLRLRFPLFTGGDLQERTRQARIERERARTVSEKIARTTRVEVKRHWLSVQEAAARSRSQGSAVEQAKRALEVTEVRYKGGESNQLELTDATLALQRARLLQAFAMHDFRVELAALERAVGSPIEEAVR
ncbi:MAG: hypothetical protein A2X36_09765 [Elusimicrobia bacterium GWA2_69_24]|nr:MAG: hypothetical protein A2X36_09765 [Elusimicrobia bacterium GWA2_69_24]HBL15545.1 hypothetical protein [Elusimicrobiota bacterium]